MSCVKFYVPTYPIAIQGMKTNNFMLAQIHTVNPFLKQWMILRIDCTKMITIIAIMQ